MILRVLSKPSSALYADPLNIQPALRAFRKARGGHCRQASAAALALSATPARKPFGQVLDALLCAPVPQNTPTAVSPAPTPQKRLAGAGICRTCMQATTTRQPPRKAITLGAAPTAMEVQATVCEELLDASSALHNYACAWASRAENVSAVQTHDESSLRTGPGDKTSRTDPRQSVSGASSQTPRSQQASTSPSGFPSESNAGHSSAMTLAVAFEGRFDF